jgi:hypothetical protein
MMTKKTHRAWLVPIGIVLLIGTLLLLGVPLA